jgi:hypothetical protein
VAVPPPLDRRAARKNVAMIATWRSEIEDRYHALLARTDATQADDAESIRAFEDSCRDDQEWAAGYEAGRADAERVKSGSAAAGPGISWFGDGFSAGLTREAAYEVGLADGDA